jgi:hypothetical protein
MNYRHCNDAHPSNFPAAVTYWESYADDLAMLVELRVRVIRTKQQISKAVTLEEQVLMQLYEVRDNLERLQLRADEVAGSVRPIT